MDTQAKLSYKSVVCEKPAPSLLTTRQGLFFTAWEDLPFHSQPELLRHNFCTSNFSNASAKQSKREATYKKEVLLDVLNEMAYVTEYVQECFGCKGIGDELKLEDVLNALETSINVDVHSDVDIDFGISEEDDS